MAQFKLGVYISAELDAELKQLVRLIRWAYLSQLYTRRELAYVVFDFAVNRKRFTKKNRMQWMSQSLTILAPPTKFDFIPSVLTEMKPEQLLQTTVAFRERLVEQG